MIYLSNSYNEDRLYLPAVAVGEKRPITVETPNTNVPCKITHTTPKGQQNDLPVKKVKQGFEALFAPLEEGPNLVKVNVAGKDVPGSPFPVNVQPDKSAHNQPDRSAPNQPDKSAPKGTSIEISGVDTRK